MREYPEKYITAFMTSSRRSEILKSAKIGKDKYYTLKNDADFMKIVNDRRSEIIKDAVLKMESYLGENIEILQNIIRNPDTKDQVKVNALKLFSDQLGQWKNTSDILERLQHLEDMQGQNADV